MKNCHGAASQNVCSSIWKVFVTKSCLLKCNAAANIVSWKESPQVKRYFCALFEQNNEGVLWISLIARIAFSTVAVPVMADYYCAFTLAVCNILLNLWSQNICTKKYMKRRMEQYLVSTCKFLFIIVWNIFWHFWQTLMFMIKIYYILIA